MIFYSPLLLTMRSKAALIHNGAVVISRDAILAAGPADKIIKRYPGHRVYHLENSVLMPGLVNLHTHLELPPLLNEIRARAFPDWVMNLIRAKISLRNRDYETAVQENIATLIHSGTTTVGEICTHGISPVYLKQSGLRAIVFHEIIKMGGNQVQSSKFKVQSSKEIVSPLIHKGLSPHAPHTVSEAALRGIRAYALKYNLPLSMHVAESKDELRLLQGKKSGLEKLYRLAGWDLAWAPSAASSFEYLRRIGFLSPNLLAVHAVWVTDRDIGIIKKSRVPVAHCPRSNKETGVGKMPLKKFIDAGITVGLGTDSLASSPSLSIWDEMRYAYRIHNKDGITARDILRLAVINGAKALGLEKEIGSLEPGKKADIIAVPLPRKNTGDIYSDLLRETKSCSMTMVNGKILYLNNSREKQ